MMQAELLAHCIWQCKMASVLRDPTILTLSPPVRMRAVGLDETTMSIGFSDRRDSYEILTRVDETNLLYSILSCAIKKECWQEYLYTNLMLFEWEFNGNIITSCSPFFELLMRCMRKLLIMFNELTKKKIFPETDEMDNLVCQINLAFNGLVNGAEDDEVCLSVFQPALFFPPLLRSEYRCAFEKRGVEIARGISVYSFQFILYMILAETWLISMEDSTRKMMSYNNKDLFERINHLCFLVTKMYREILQKPYGTFENDTNYQKYIYNRYDTESTISDLNRIHLLSKAFTLEKREIILYEKSLVSIAHSFVPDVYLKLKNIVKLNSKFFLNKSKKTVHIRIFEKCGADDYFATPYQTPECEDWNVEMIKMMTLPKGNILLHVEAHPSVTDSIHDDIFEKEKKTKYFWLQCIF